MSTTVAFIAFWVAVTLAFLAIWTTGWGLPPKLIASAGVTVTVAAFASVYAYERGAK